MSSDFKNHRVEDPTKISSRQEKQVKKYVKEYFDKAVAKKREHEKKKGERRGKEGESATSPTPAMIAEVKKGEESDGDQDMAMSDDDEYEKSKLESATPMTPSDQLLQAEGLKRKRFNEEDNDSFKFEDNEATPSKRLKSESPPSPPSPPPPPPPPPPAGTPSESMYFSTGGTEDVNQDSHAANRSLGDTEPMVTSPENNSDPLPRHPASNDTARAIEDGVDISDNAQTPDTPSEDERIFGGNGQIHRPDIEVHGAA